MVVGNKSTVRLEFNGHPRDKGKLVVTWGVFVMITMFNHALRTCRKLIRDYFVKSSMSSDHLWVRWLGVKITIKSSWKALKPFNYNRWPLRQVWLYVVSLNRMYGIRGKMVIDYYNLLFNYLNPNVTMIDLILLYVFHQNTCMPNQKY